MSLIFRPYRLLETRPRLSNNSDNGLSRQSVVIAASIHKVLRASLTRSFRSTSTMHQMLATLSSNRPLPTGNKRVNACANTQRIGSHAKLGIKRSCSRRDRHTHLNRQKNKSLVNLRTNAMPVIDLPNYCRQSLNPVCFIH